MQIRVEKGNEYQLLGQIAKKVLKQHSVSMELPDFLKLFDDKKEIFTTVKVDGEFTVFRVDLPSYYDNRGAYSSGVGGKVRTEFHALIELSLKASGLSLKSAEPIKSIVFFGEIYAVDKEDRPLPFANVVSALHKEDDRPIRIALFNIGMYNGKPWTMAYEQTLPYLAQAYSLKNKWVSVVPHTVLKTRGQAQDYWNTWIVQKGYEGFMAYDGNRILKVKPQSSVDAVIIGIDKEGERMARDPPEIGSVRVALLDLKGELIDLGKVGNGWEDIERRDLYQELIKTKVNESDDMIYVQPKHIIEIEYNETQPMKLVNNYGTIDKFDGGVKKESLGTMLRHPKRVQYVTPEGKTGDYPMISEHPKTVNKDDISILQLPSLTKIYTEYVPKTNPLSREHGEPQVGDVIVQGNQNWKIKEIQHIPAKFIKIGDAQTILILDTDEILYPEMLEWDDGWFLDFDHKPIRLFNLPIPNPPERKFKDFQIYPYEFPHPHEKWARYMAMDMEDFMATFPESSWYHMIIGEVRTQGGTMEDAEILYNLLLIFLNQKKLPTPDIYYRFFTETPKALVYRISKEYFYLDIADQSDKLQEEVERTVFAKGGTLNDVEPVMKYIMKDQFFEREPFIENPPALKCAVCGESVLESEVEWAEETSQAYRNRSSEDIYPHAICKACRSKYDDKAISDILDVEVTSMEDNPSVGMCSDKDGNLSKLVKIGEKYYRENPGEKSIFDVSIKSQKWSNIIKVDSIENAKKALAELTSSWSGAQNRDFKRRLKLYANLAANRAKIMAGNMRLKPETRTEKGTIAKLYRDWVAGHKLPVTNPPEGLVYVYNQTDNILISPNPVPHNIGEAMMEGYRAPFESLGKYMDISGNEHPLEELKVSLVKEEELYG